MSRIRVLLADDHADVLDGVSAILEDDFDVVGRVTDGLALVSAARSVLPDVIVSDISMPKLDGMEAARQLRMDNVAAKIVFLTVHDEDGIVEQALESGADGYVLKRSAPADLPIAIQEALAGRKFISPTLCHSSSGEGDPSRPTE